MFSPISLKDHYTEHTFDEALEFLVPYLKVTWKSIHQNAVASLCQEVREGHLGLSALRKSNSTKPLISTIGTHVSMRSSRIECADLDKKRSSLPKFPYCYSAR